jgi:hypothetical protein
MYYLNAFNEMQRKRRQNMMGGEGNDYGVGTTAPSGPLGLGPAQDRNAFRDTLNSMSPMSRFAVGMMPVIGPAFNVGRLVDAGISAYQGSQLAPSRDARERAQDQFRASEISEMNAPVQNTPQQSFQTGEITANRAATDYTDYSDVFTDRTSTAVPGFVAPQSTFDTTTFGGDAAAADNSYGGFGDTTGGTTGFGGEYAHGGMVHAEHLKGRAPAPDDGYGALQGGEYVITKAAVEKYGKRLLDAINNGTFR